MKKILLIIFLIGQGFGWGLDLSRVEVLLAGKNPEGAKQVLLEQYAQTKDKSEEEQIQFLLGQIAANQGKLDEAAAIYRKMLTANPTLHRVRLELGYIYFQQNRDDQARYHFRMVLAEKEIPLTACIS